ncbi:MAG: hypothetical protein ACYTG1_02990 [Planctomycetota bacterium]|jgi:hypothetical protein
MRGIRYSARYTGGIAPRTLILLVPLAIAVAAAPLRAAWAAHDHRDVPRGAGPVHEHEHFHGDRSHSHAHHHHDGTTDDEGSGDHHHGVVDHAPDGPKARWTAPRRVEVDAPPAAPSLPAVEVATDADWEPTRRARPPPRAPAPSHHLSPIRTVILRL